MKCAVVFLCSVITFGDALYLKSSTEKERLVDLLKEVLEQKESGDASEYKISRKTIEAPTFVNKLGPGVSESNTYDGSQAKFVEAWLECHNKVRAIHSVAPLVWDSALASDAQQSADACADKGYIYHNKPQLEAQSEGENLFQEGPAQGFQYEITPAEACIAWYAEEWENNYDFNSNNGGAGHFTQMVWKGSQRVGCAIAYKNQGGSESAFASCRYQPPGNYVGQYTNNVFPPTVEPHLNYGDLEMTCKDHSSICGMIGKGICNMQGMSSTCPKTCSLCQ